MTLGPVDTALFTHSFFENISLPKLKDNSLCKRCRSL